MNGTAIRFRTASATVLAAVVFGACSSDSTTDPLADPGDGCMTEVDLFPVPVSDGNSPFPSADDSFFQVAFDPAFQFSFYGTPYSSVFLNTNGGMTFGGGDGNFDEAAADVGLPTIAVFWGDMDAAEAEQRANQMKYQVCADRFVVRYQQLQDWDEPTWNNSATVTLSADGTITVAYGSVLSQDILVGVFDGTHANDQYVAVQGIYAGYSTVATGTILFDAWGQGPGHVSQLTNRSITYTP